MPRYEFREGTSSKFWQIDLAEDAFTTTWGKIGTNGQSAIKSFDSAAKAKVEYEKLIAEKVRKGYQPVAGASSSAAPTATATAAAKPVVRAAKPAPAAKPVAATADAKVEAAPPAPAVAPRPTATGAPEVLADAALAAAATRGRTAAAREPAPLRALYQASSAELRSVTQALTYQHLHGLLIHHYHLSADLLAPILEHSGIDAVPFLAATLRLCASEGDVKNWQKQWLYSMAAAAAHALRWVRRSPEAVEAAVFTLSKLGDLALPKDMDPRPALLETLRNAPDLALPLVQAAAREKGGGWAKDLVVKLERLTGAGEVLPEASAAELPASLRASDGDGFRAPPWWTPAEMVRPELGSHKALPLAALDALAARLKAAVDSENDALDDIKQACTPESLADFGWDLFNSWLSAGAPSKDKWAFLALGVVGNDQTARRLTPLIRAWPGESQHQRAVGGLDVLGRIGSDVAMMMLNGVAQKVKFKGLQERARLKMDEIAAKRGLTAEELSDRLVPDLDLEDDGSKTLDFGPRSFRVGFDEALTPFVMDATGARLKELPKPNSKDDAELAGASTEAWKAMKKDARTIAALQVLRLELAMGNARRWKPVDFEAFLVQHPLLIHLVRRMVWGTWKNGKPVSTFRVAEDRSYADVADDSFTLPADVAVGVMHRLELDDGEATKWGKLFADYELLQPFEQLGRQTFALTQEEKVGSALHRFEGRVIETKKLLGLGSRGWRRGDAQDAGMVFNFYKPIAKDLLADLTFENGINAGGMDYVDPTQTLGTIEFLTARSSWGQRSGAVALKSIDPVILSEVLRDVDALGTTG